MFRLTWQDTTRNVLWGLVLVTLFVLWLFLIVVAKDLSSDPAQVSNVTQTLSTLTYTAAFFVPVSVLVAIVGASSMLRQLRTSRDPEDQALGKRLARLNYWAATVTATVTLFAAVSVVFVSNELYAGTAAATAAAIGLAGFVLSGVVVEVALLLAIIAEISLRYG